MSLPDIEVMTMGSRPDVDSCCGSRRTCAEIKENIDKADLWKIPGQPEEQRAHLLAAEPFGLTGQQVNQLNDLGGALLAFYRAMNDLYLKGSHEWVREYLNIGKSEDLIRHASMKYQRKAIPGIIRPDILITSEGFVITELDSVPGGFGHLDCLSVAYEHAGWELIGSKRGIRDGFANMLKSQAESDDPTCAIVVSDESVDYLPEMNYIASELRHIGLRAYTVRPRDISFTEEGLFIEPEGAKQKIDVLYRFFELFDQLNIPKAELISYAARKKLVVVTPPYKPHLEEKMLLAFIHSEYLKDYWLSAIGEDNYFLLRKVIAPTWVMDNRQAPPNAEISGFRWKGSPIRDWREIKSGTQKERALVLKPSGFSPLAWGARGVKVGHDMPETEWAETVDIALASFNSNPYVLQPFRDTSMVGVSYFDGSCEDPGEMRARVRLCPYYFVIEDEARLGGVLATACPKDKKLIHGMVDAVMMPCRLSPE